MFRGVNPINLDAKGRLAIPTKYRKALKDCCDGRMIVTVAVDERGVGEKGCLWLYPLAEWEDVEKTINDLPTLNKKARRLQRFLIGYANECEMDAQGRLSLPEKLRKFAGLDKQAVLLGQLNKFEIWNGDIWEAQEDDWLNGDDDSDDLPEFKTLSF